MAEEIERYVAQVTIRHKFENVTEQHEFERANQQTQSLPVPVLHCAIDISCPTLFARNIPFSFALSNGANGVSCSLDCMKYQRKRYSVNVKYQLSLITPSKTVQSAEFSRTFHRGVGDLGDDVGHSKALSEIFPGEKIIVDGAVTLEVSLWVDEPKGITDFMPPKEKLRQELQITGNEVHANNERLLDSRDYSDVTFVVNEDSSRVKAHKTILAAQSDVFARMFSTDMKEARDAEIKIEDMGATALKIMLRYIYTGQLVFPKGVEVDLNICQELANAGEKYNLQKLKEYAAMAMTEFVSLENAWELLVFVKSRKAEAATKALTAYVGKNVYKIIEKL